MESTYRNLVAKLNAARVRRESLHGREYLVVPTTIMRPDSVMNGSKGPLFYPRSEVAKHPGAWNGMPLLLNHPTSGSTGRTPENVRRFGLGYVYNDRVTRNGNRAVDAWFDVKLVKAHDAQLPDDKRILPRLESGQPIDVSTGLFTDDRPHTSYSKNALKDFRGRRYEGDVATNYRPDHLAVLPTVKGACSAKDGCGTGVENAEWEVRVTGNSNEFFSKCARDASGHCTTGLGGAAGGMLMQAAILDGMNQHNKKIRESKLRAEMTAVDPLGGSKRTLWVHDHPEHGLTYTMASSNGTPMHIEKSELLPKKWGKGVKEKIKEHLKKHDYLTFNSDPTELAYNRDWPQAKRDALATKDFAGPGQSFPIQTQADVDAAAHLVGKAADPEAVKTRIMLIAKRKGLTVPESWNSEGTTMTRRERKAKQVKYLTANCECWKGDKAKALNSLADDVVDGLYRKLKDDEAKDAALNAVRAELGIADDAEVTQELVANALNAKACDMAEEMGEGEGEMPMKGKKKVAATNAEDEEKGTVDLKDVFKQLPPDQQASLNRMFKRDKARKVQVINKLKDIAKATRNERKRGRIEEKLANNAATIEDLEELLDLVDEATPKRNAGGDGLDFLDDEDVRLNDYRAMGGGGPRRDEEDELLQEPTENESDAGSDMDGDAGDFSSYGRNRFTNVVALNGQSKK